MPSNYSYINSFAAVEERYNTRPIGGQYNTPEDDIRPINDRRRKWERIVKISKNCYALVTHNRVYNAPLWGDRDSHTLSTLQDVARTAPIVWRRHKDGTETVTVHNDVYSNATRHYEFLRAHLPGGLFFSNHGPHKIKCTLPNGDTGSYFLPRNRFTSKAINAKGGYSTYVSRNKLSSKPSAEIGLTFKRSEQDAPPYYSRNRWEVIGPTHEDKLVNRSGFYVDKDRKKALKPKIDAFREWLFAIMPMLHMPRNYVDRRAVLDTLQVDLKALLDTLDDSGKGYVEMWGNWWTTLDERLVQHAIDHDDSPARMALAYGFVQYNGALERSYEWQRDNAESTEKQVKARFNSYINTVLNLRKKSD